MYFKETDVDKFIEYYEQGDGECYPRDFTVSIPTADFAVEMHTIQSEPEFQKAYGPIHMNGCQALCTMKGHYKDIQIDRVEIVEMLGDLCGE